MADHRDTPDPRTDITDLNVFRSTGAAAESGPIGEVVSGAPVSVGGQVQNVAVDGYQFLAGLRSDPWFFDVDGLRNDFQFTGHDAFADRNVFGIVLEVPNAAHGTAAPIRLWARTMAPVHGQVVQVDQAGRPGINTVFNRAEADRAAFNETPPTDQPARSGAKSVAAIRSMGYSEVQADDLALGLLPGALEYASSDPGGYPNGRRLTDDIADLRVAVVTMGRVTSDGVGPHTDLLDEFPISARRTLHDGRAQERRRIRDDPRPFDRRIRPEVSDARDQPCRPLRTGCHS